jgi:hypothetical protein
VGGIFYFPPAETSFLNLSAQYRPAWGVVASSLFLSVPAFWPFSPF